jgi:hypothetical protein
MLLRQESGLPVSWIVCFATSITLFGNIYWGEDSYRFFDNSVQLSVLAYHIIKANGKHQELLRKIQGYFLEQRSIGEWRNTYESALILETILPDLLIENKQVKPSANHHKGRRPLKQSVSSPTQLLLKSISALAKPASLPVYITGSQKFWNSKPEKVSKDFTVNTWFERKGQKVTSPERR